MKRIPVKATVTKLGDKYFVAVALPNTDETQHGSCMCKQNVGRTARGIASRSLNLPEHKINVTEVVYK